MGSGIAALGDPDGIDRLACETLPNGVVIARDARRGTAYIIEVVPDDEASHDETMEVSSEEAPLETLGEEDMEPGAREAAGRLSAWESSFEVLTDEEPDTVDTGELEVLLDPTDDEEVVARLERLLSTPTPRAAWASALALARELVPSEAGAAVALDADGALVFIAAEGPRSAGVLGLRLPAGAGFVGLCVQRRLALNVRDVRRDGRHFAAVDERTGFSTRAVLCAPVAAEARVFGCLELLNPLGQSRFTRTHLELVEMVAGSLAERLTL